MWNQPTVPNLTDDAFESEILSCDSPALVFFGADWSGWSHIMEPVVERLARETIGELKVCRMDAERNARTAVAFDVETIPSLLYFRNGHLIARRDGPVPAADLVALHRAIARSLAGQDTS